MSEHLPPEGWPIPGGYMMIETRNALLPLPPVAVEGRTGTVREAWLFAAQANATHGLPRTDADKRRAVTALLEDEEWRRRGGREIARFLRVSEGLVRKVKGELGIPAHDAQIPV